MDEAAKNCSLEVSQCTCTPAHAVRGQIERRVGVKLWKRSRPDRAFLENQHYALSYKGDQSVLLLSLDDSEAHARNSTSWQGERSEKCFKKKGGIWPEKSIQK